MRELAGILRAFVYGGAACAGAVTFLVLAGTIIAGLARRAIAHDIARAVDHLKSTKE